MSVTTFVNNYSPHFNNHKVNEERYRKSNNKPAGFHDDIQLSKNLSYLLRHGALKEGLPLQPGGYINVDEILNHRRFRGKCTTDDIKRVVIQDSKQRYFLRNDPLTGHLQIRANQGHTIVVQEDGTLFQPLSIDDQLAEITHGTTPSAWMSIQKSGLSRMKRNHIHFVPGVAESTNEMIPGLRQRSKILIVVDVRKAMFDGVQFFRSRNNVILSPGDSRGYISTKYFKKVINTTTNENIWPVTRK